MPEQDRVLVVDDEIGMCEFLRYLLEGEGYEVDQAYSADEALAKIENNAFHVVLTDIKMPGMDGLDMLRLIKQTDEDVVVIVMTAYSTLETAIKAIRYDAYNYLVKPFDNPQVVIDAVAEGLAQYQRPPDPTES